MLSRNTEPSVFSGLHLNTLLAVIALALCMNLAAGALHGATAETQSQPETHAAPQRIVVFPLFAEEMLLEMVGPERIVFVGHPYFANGEGHSPTMPLTEHIPGNDWQNTGEDEYLALKPDMVVFDRWDVEADEGLQRRVEQTGATVLCLDWPQNAEDIRRTLRILGEAVDAQEKAARMVRDMDAKLAYVAQTVAALPQDRRMRATYFGREPVFDTSGEVICSVPNEFAMVARAAGVVNASGSDTDYDVITRERLVEWNPDLLTVVPALYDTDGSILEVGDEYVRNTVTSFLEDPALASVAAIRNRNVHPLRLSNSQFYAQSVLDLARLAYPDLFPADGE